MKSVEYQPSLMLNGEVMKCKPEDVEFWSVYVRKDDGTVDFLADLPDKREAQHLANTVGDLFGLSVIENF